MGPAVSLARSKRPRTLLCAHGFTTTLVARLIPVCDFLGQDLRLSTARWRGSARA